MCGFSTALNVAISYFLVFAKRIHERKSAHTLGTKDTIGQLGRYIAAQIRICSIDAVPFSGLSVDKNAGHLVCQYLSLHLSPLSGKLKPDRVLWATRVSVVRLVVICA